MNDGMITTNLPTGPRLGRILGDLDSISLQLEVMAQAQCVADGEVAGDMAVRLIQLQHSVLEARKRARLAVDAVNRASGREGTFTLPGPVREAPVAPDED